MMPQDEQERRKLELGNAALQALAALQPVRDGSAHWLVAVRCLSELGDAAARFMADYYDAMTAEEMDVELTESGSVQIEAPRGEPKIGFWCGFTRAEMREIKEWDNKAYTGDVVHDAALRWIREAEGMRIALAKLKGSAPTRAEILTGLMLDETPPGAVE